MTPPTVELSPLAIQTILAALISDDKLFKRWWPVLGDDFFSDPYYKKIAAHINAFWVKYSIPPDPMVLADHFQSTAFSEEDREVYEQIFLEIFSAPVENWPHYRDHLQLYVRKQAFTTALDLSERLIDKLDFEGALKAIQDAATVGISVDSGVMRPYEKAHVDRRYDRRSVDDKLIPKLAMNIGNLDNHMRGGLRPKTLTIFVATTGGGKSTALVHLGKQALIDGKKVLHVTLELENEDIADKYDSTFTGIKTDDLESCAGMVGAALGRILAGTKYAENLTIVERPEFSMSPLDLEALLIQLEMVNSFVPEVLLLDYADLMTGGPQFKGGKDRRFELNFLYTWLHRLAKARNLIVVTATQANRGALAKTIIGLEDIAEDISKAWIADHIFAICQTPREREDQRCRLRIAKNRKGKCDVEIAFGQNLGTCTFATGAGASRTISPEELGDITEEIISAVSPA